MKFKYLFLFLIISIFCFTSCSIQKRSHCSGYHIEWISQKKSPDKISKAESSSLLSSENVSYPVNNNEDEFVLSNEEIYSDNSSDILTNTKTYKRKYFEECDKIILNNGDEIKVKVTELTIDSIRYQTCENSDGRIFTIAKSDVFVLKYMSGTKQFFKSSNAVVVQTNAKKKSPSSATGIAKQEPLGVVGLVMAVAGWLMPAFGAALLLCAIAVVLGVISLDQIKKYPERYKGKGFGIVAITLGLIGIIILITADISFD